MKIIKPSATIQTPLDAPTVYAHLERCGRTAYKSEAAITATSAPKFLKAIIARGHESVLEHYSFTVRFVVDRGVSHELVRHRLCAFTQESTRYCNYRNQGELTFIQPCFAQFQPGQPLYTLWEGAMASAERTYLTLIDNGAKPEQARLVLPNSLKTEVVTSANVRQWRHILSLRTDKRAHPQIREVMTDLQKQLNTLLPVLFPPADELGNTINEV